MEKPEIFCDETFLASNQFILSTSQVTCDLIVSKELSKHINIHGE